MLNMNPNLAGLAPPPNVTVSRQTHWTREEHARLAWLVKEHGKFDCALFVEHFPGRTRSSLKGAYDRGPSRWAAPPSQDAVTPPTPPPAAGDFDAVKPPSAGDFPIDLLPEDVQMVRTLEPTEEEQQLQRLLENDDNGWIWMDEDWKMQAEEELRAGVDAPTSVDDSAQECHIASMRRVEKAKWDRMDEDWKAKVLLKRSRPAAVLEPPSPRRTRRRSA